jgi:catechol 2,3-dioxygenase-like lactoylglutathione lyase family enzyme
MIVSDAHASAGWYEDAMFRGIDHIVIAVRELETAIRRYSEAGFTVVRGGRHNLGTHNALIALADGSYIELIAFLNPMQGHPWQAALDKGGGIVDFCMQTDDLAADVELLRRAGATMGDPVPMTRDRPDGYRLSWVLSIPAPPFSGQLPFLIKDETPRDERVPRDHTHRIGATGLESVTVAVENPDSVSRIYARVMGQAGAPLQRPELDAAGVAFPIGLHRIELAAPMGTSGPLAEHLRARGDSPYEAALTGARKHTRLDPALIEGARLRVG